MKSEKGVALTSIIMYIIIMLVVISIISVFTTFFYNNVDEIGKEVDPSQEITRFNSFFVSDINKSNISVLECNKDQDYIIFSDGTQYTYKNNCIYRGKVKICESIYDMTFESEKDENEKDIVIVKYKLTKDKEEQTSRFTL